eukprot:s4024_g2.t1
MWLWRVEGLPPRDRHISVWHLQDVNMTDKPTCTGTFAFTARIENTFGIMVLLEALAARLTDIWAEIQRDAPIDVRAQAALIVIIGIVLTVVVPWYDELSKKGSGDKSADAQGPPAAALKQPVAEEPSVGPPAPIRSVGRSPRSRCTPCCFGSVH